MMYTAVMAHIAQPSSDPRKGILVYGYSEGVAKWTFHGEDEDIMRSIAGGKKELIEDLKNNYIVLGEN